MPFHFRIVGGKRMFSVHLLINYSVVYIPCESNGKIEMKSCAEERKHCSGEKRNSDAPLCTKIA